MLPAPLIHLTLDEERAQELKFDGSVIPCRSSASSMAKIFPPASFLSAAVDKMRCTLFLLLSEEFYNHLNSVSD